MSAKWHKKKRAWARRAYRTALFKWMRAEPPKWRIFAYRRWKRQKPKHDKYGGLIR